MQLIVLSAGRGSRLPKKFRNKPKYLVKVKSKLLISCNYKFFENFKKKIIVIGYKHNHLKKITEKISFKNILKKLCN
jgi:choline kinase